VRTSWYDEAVVNADACDARERDEGVPVFFSISGKLATHTLVLPSQSASVDESSLVAAAFATAFFGGAAVSSLGAAAFGAGAGFLKTGAAFGCAAARLLRAGFAAAFRGALDLLVEGARRTADAAADAVALLLLLFLLDDPAAAVTGALRFRRCVGLPSSSLLLELPSSEEEDRLSIVLFGCLSLLFFGLLCYDVVGALEPVDEEGFDKTQRNPTHLR